MPENDRQKLLHMILTLRAELLEAKQRISQLENRVNTLVTRQQLKPDHVADKPPQPEQAIEPAPLKQTAALDIDNLIELELAVKSHPPSSQKADKATVLPNAPPPPLQASLTDKADTRGRPPAPESAATPEPARTSGAQPTQTTAQTSAPEVRRTPTPQNPQTESIRPVALTAQTAPARRTIKESAEVPLHKTSVANKATKLTSPASRRPSASETPNLLSRFWQSNPLLKIGVIILFIGVGFLLRYTSQFITVPLPLRYLSVASAGGAMTAFAWFYLRPRQYDYALVVQGTGIAIWYLSILAALKIHHLLGSDSAFLLMLIPLAVMVSLALLQNAVLLAQVALIGGLATPILTSTGHGDYVILFGYLALLNSGFVVMAWYRRWRSLNLIAFFGSVIIALVWMERDAQLASPIILSIFIAYHLLLFTLAAWRFTCLAGDEDGDEDGDDELANDASLDDMRQYLVQRLTSHAKLDATLIFSAAFTAFALLYALWRHAAVAVALAAYYGIWSWYCARYSPQAKVLSRIFFLLGALFVALAIPLYFSNQATIMCWALQAALLYYFGQREQQPYWRLTAIGVYALSLLLFIPQIHLANSPYLISAPWLQWILLTITALFISVSAWYDTRRFAQWELNGVYGVCITLVFLTTIAPFIFLPTPLATMLVLAIGMAQLVITPMVSQRAAAILNAGAAVNAAIWLRWFVPHVLGSYSDLRAALPYDIITIVILGATLYAMHRQQQRGTSEHNPLYPAYGTAHFAKIVPLLTHTVFLLTWLTLSLALSPSSHQFLTMSLLALALQSLIIASPLLAHPQTKQISQFWLLPLSTIPVVWRILSDVSSMPQQQELFFYSTRYVTNFIWLIACAGLITAHIISRNPQRPFARVWGFNLYTVALLWPIWQVTYQTIGWTGGWTILLYAAPALAAITYAGSALRTRWVAAAQAHDGVGWLAGVMVAYIILLMQDPTQSAFFLPVLNPVTLLGISIAALVWWQYRPLPQNNALRYTVLIVAWLLSNIEIMRLWRVYADIPWALPAFAQSLTLQVTFSLLWSIEGIVLMVWANRNGARQIWFSGTALLSLVILKLFFVELANSNTIERVVSFIGVGILLMLVGYFAPLPPEEDG